MPVTIFQVDAFTSQVFSGNPAAVCPLNQWLTQDQMQSIAAENNLSETAFFVKQGMDYELRWFTPTTEVDLCGHATLAAAWVLFNELQYSGSTIHFSTRSGPLSVSRQDEKLTLDFPLQQPIPCDTPQLLSDALATSIQTVVQGDDYLVVVDNEESIRQLSPDFSLLQKLPLRGVVVTAQGENVDFVSRWFGPKVGVNEDPVTGSAHTLLAPYWSSRLGKTHLFAQQLSSRGGEIECQVMEQRVLLSGYAVKYLEGSIYL